jgi:hypothetical protein
MSQEPHVPCLGVQEAELQVLLRTGTGSVARSALLVLVLLILCSRFPTLPSGSPHIPTEPGART